VLRQACSSVWRFSSAPWRGRRIHSHALRTRPEFEYVNRLNGTQPLTPELSGLELQPPENVPHWASHMSVELRYRWGPSSDYHQRQIEMHRLNRVLETETESTHVVPPILTYPEEGSVAPTRLQPMPGHERESGFFSHDHLPRDLSDLEAEARHRAPWVLEQGIPEPDPDHLMSHRPLLPRQYRDFLRYSPYPRIGMGMATAFSVLLASVWFSQMEQAQALAAEQVHQARHALRTELDGARRYGVNPALLRPLARLAHALDVSSPTTSMPGPTHAGFYRQQAHEYALLRDTVRRLEGRALHYWTAQEAAAYLTLASAVMAADEAGMHLPTPLFSTCATPACLRPVVLWQGRHAAWLRQATRTLHLYAAQIAAAQDPAVAATTSVQRARDLRAILPAAISPPVEVPSLDGALATANSTTEFSRVGALGRLAGDALERALVQRLPRHAVGISLATGRLTCYEAGRAIYSSLVVPGPATRTGIFHILARRRSLPVTLWGGGGQFMDGALPNWMLLGGDAALQAAPWRTSFGLDAASPAYGPYTPSSIDLPPAAAQHVYRWVTIGTEVVVY
jgi:hypothetical protein